MKERIRKLYYADNLPILRGMEDKMVDLIYLDPPFNSNRTYHIIYPNDEAQAQAFTDVWSWGTAEDNLLKEIAQLHTKATDVIQALVDGLGKVQLCAYLVNMTIRLVELHRVLKDTGSLYLHCDATASHYLKMVLDGIFGNKNFRNEIIWYYPNSGFKAKSRKFHQVNDIILFYVKTSTAHTWNPQRMPLKGGVEYRKQAKRKFNAITKKADVVRDAATGKPVYMLTTDRLVHNVWEIPMLNTGEERLGYPTQKPITLLDRIIKTSSNRGDIVLDPFCGCGTSVESAENNNRQWIGIDITYASIASIQERFKKKRGDVWDKVELIGKPTTKEAVANLLTQRQSSLYVRKEFEKFVVAQVGGLPNEKMGADGGIDGSITLSTKQQAIISVKSGKVHVEQVRALKGILDGKKYVAGIFITYQPPTKAMLDFVHQTGVCTSQEEGALSFGSSFPLVQILTLEEVLQGKMPDVPYMHKR